MCSVIINYRAADTHFATQGQFLLGAPSCGRVSSSHVWVAVWPSTRVVLVPSCSAFYCLSSFTSSCSSSSARRCAVLSSAAVAPGLLTSATPLLWCRVSSWRAVLLTLRVLRASSACSSSSRSSSFRTLKCQVPKFVATETFWAAVRAQIPSVR